MPNVFGKEAKKKELIKNLGQIYDQIEREQQIPDSDFPGMKKMQEALAHHDFSKFNSLKPKLLEVVDNMFIKDIAKLMTMIPHEETGKTSELLVKGIPFYLYFPLILVARKRNNMYQDFTFLLLNRLMHRFLRAIHLV